MGELVQADTSTHDWLERRGGPLKLILTIDDAAGKWYARFATLDSREKKHAGAGRISAGTRSSASVFTPIRQPCFRPR